MGYSIWDYNRLTKTFDPNLMGHYYVISIKICWFHFSIASSGRFEAFRIDQALAMTLPPPSMVPGTARFGADGWSSQWLQVVKIWGRKSPFQNLIPPITADSNRRANTNLGLMNSYVVYPDEYFLSLLMFLTLAFHFAKLSKIPGKLMWDFQDSGRL